MLRKLLGKILGSTKKAAPAPAKGSAHAAPTAGTHGRSHGHASTAKSGSAPHGGSKPHKVDAGRHPDKRDTAPRAPGRDAGPKRGDHSSTGKEHRSHGGGHAGHAGTGTGTRSQGHGPSHGGGKQGASHSRPPAEGATGGTGRGAHARGDDFASARSGEGQSGSAGDERRGSRRGGRGRGRGRGGDRGAGGEQGGHQGGPREGEESTRRAHREPHGDSSASPSEVTETPAAPAPETTVPLEIPAISADNEFSDLGLEPFVVAAVEAKGYTQPTPIQSEAIPFILNGRDVIGSAQTGTGKTAAFALPILQKLGSHGKLRCLILEPTRELALQVDEAIHAYGKFTNLRNTVIFGGVGYGPQRDAITRGLDIIVATPGRLLDHLEQRSFHLKEVNLLVLDEVDRMLDMGFLPDVKRIIEQCPADRQTLFFSATIPPELESLTKWVLRDPHTIEIGRRRMAAETVSHAFYPVIESQKFDLLKALLEQTHYESVIVFCRTKHGADFVANRLSSQGHKVAVMHSNRSQSERMEALKGFKSGKYEMLVATDLAARGLDIAGVTHVINFDTPQHAEDYVHRIGRTGRAESEGDAFTLLTEDEMKHAFAIERFIGQKVERKKIENFPYQYSAIFESAAGAPKNQFRSRLYRGTRK